MLILALLVAQPPEAQTLSVPDSETHGETPGFFSLMLDSPSGKAPVALQWNFLAPSAIAMASSDIRLGSAAESAKKSIACAVDTKAPAPRGAVRLACILAGGREPIGSGPIAVVRYRAQSDVQGAPIRVSIENVVGVAGNLQKIEIPNAVAILHIR